MIFNRLLIFLLFSLSSLYARAQFPGYSWARNSTGNLSEEGSSVACDLSGNVYVAGKFASTTITFGSITLTNTGGLDAFGVPCRDIFIVKYSPSGTVLWAKKAGGTNSDEGLEITTDKSGNVIMGGRFWSSSITIESTVLTNSGVVPTQDSFIAKYSPTGTLIWAKKAGCSSFDNIFSLTTDQQNNIYFSGNFDAPFTIFGTDTISASGTVSSFVAKCDSLGNIIWSTITNGFVANDISIDPNDDNNIFVTGQIGASISFGVDSLTVLGGGDSFVGKYDSNGNPIWGKISGTPNTESTYGVAADFSGNVCLTGIFTGPTMSIGSITLNNTNPIGYNDVFIAKYDSVGNLLWAKNGGGSHHDYSQAITTDLNDNIYVTGYYQSPSIAFDSKIAFNIDPTPSGQRSIFVVKYDAMGNASWVDSPPGNTLEFAYDICRGTGNSVYYTGTYQCDTMTFGTQQFFITGTRDFYLAKITDISINVSEIYNNSAFTVYPNPFNTETTISIINSLRNTNNRKLRILNLLGEEVLMIPVSSNVFKISREKMRNGVYIMQLFEGNNIIHSQKIVIQ